MLYLLASILFKKNFLNCIKLKKTINEKKKKYITKYLKKNFKIIYKTYYFMLLPINLSLYNNKKLLREKFIKFNITLDYLLYNIFNYNYSVKKIKNNNIIEITKKLNINKFIYSKFNYYINLLI
jgi:hypothetical protein